MRNVILAAAVLLAATPAFADTWSGAYGGTIESTYSDGRVVRVYVNADHSYWIALPGGAKIKGTWADGAGQSCFTPSDPPPKPGDKPVCFALKDYKIGDTFQGEDATGKFNGVIKAGR
jgi:hypothetical protein